MSGDLAADVLRSFVERVARLEAERVSIAADIREVLAEAAGAGFDKKALRALVKNLAGTDDATLVKAYFAVMPEDDQ